MTDPFTRAVDAVHKLSPYRSRRKCEEIVTTVIEAMEVKPTGKIGKGGEAHFPDPET